MYPNTNSPLMTELQINMIMPQQRGMFIEKMSSPKMWLRGNLRNTVTLNLRFKVTVFEARKQHTCIISLENDANININIMTLIIQ